MSRIRRSLSRSWWNLSAGTRSRVPHDCSRVPHACSSAGRRRYASIPRCFSSSQGLASLSNCHLPVDTRVRLWLGPVAGTWQHSFIVTRWKSYGGDDERLAVEQELKKMSGMSEEIGAENIDKKMALFMSIVKDISQPTPELIAKLNCEAKATPDELYYLATAIFGARNHVEDGSYLLELAVAILAYAGEQGDLNALYTYAQLLRSGQGIKQSPRRAAAIFAELAKKGHPFAQYTLGIMYSSGSGVGKSHERAFELITLSAKNHVLQAYNVIGNMYRLGQGVSEDMKKAIEYYRKGCEAEDPHAYISLAYCYYHGKGVEVSHEKSFVNYLEASKSNNPLALYNVGTHYFSGEGVQQSYDKAREYYEKASMQGFHLAQVNLGNMYYTGLSVPKDIAKAKELFKQAAVNDLYARKLLETIKKSEEETKLETIKKSEEETK